MAAPLGLDQLALPSHFQSTSPPLHAAPKTHRVDGSRLAPTDAFGPVPPSRRAGVYGDGRNVARNDVGRDPSRRRKRFQKLLWVKQSYPDNYTDEATFLENLQRNPRVKPYDFWPLVADSTVIVQHVCSVIIFIVCFVGIFQERVSPVSVVGWGSFATFLGWLLWDRWARQEAEAGDAGGDRAVNPAVDGTRVAERPVSGDIPRPPRRQDSDSGPGEEPSPSLGSGMTIYAGSTSSATSSVYPSATSSSADLLQGHPPRPPLQRHTTPWKGDTLSVPGVQPPLAITPTPSAMLHASTKGSTNLSHDDLTGELKSRSISPARRGSGSGSGRGEHSRGTTIKSAILIYFTLLGLSPILKSLTRSTSSDSIWAMSFWLLVINIFFFDYSASVSSWTGGTSNDNNSSSNRMPPPRPAVASLSTNAGIMASTVLASRLPETDQVFGLTLFSIEVFGLFPIFRQHARRRGWRYHVVLTVLLVLGAGGGLGMVLGGGGDGVWKRAVVGMVASCLISALAMGGCSWWLIGLQKYKNEIYGPWDPARPIIISRRYWEDE